MLIYNLKIEGEIKDQEKLKELLKFWTEAGEKGMFIRRRVENRGRGRIVKLENNFVTVNDKFKKKVYDAEIFDFLFAESALQRLLLAHNISRTIIVKLETIEKEEEEEKKDE